METERSTQWALRSQGEAAAAGVVRLLPAFDEYVLGWRDRHFALPAEHWTKVNRGGGWVHPVVLQGGSLVATWWIGHTLKAWRLEISPFGRLAPAISRGAVNETRDISRFLGTPMDLVVAKSTATSPVHPVLHGHILEGK